MYLLSEYQYVGYAYLWSQPPNEFYSPASSAANFDGVDIEYKNNLGDGFFRIRLGYGATHPELESNGSQFAFSLKNYSALSASYLIDNWLIRATYSQANIENLNAQDLSASVSIFSQIPSALWPASQDVLNDIDISGKSSSYNALGVSYEGNVWLFHSEVGLSDNDWLPFSSSVTAYTTLGYIRDEVTYFISLSRIKNRKKLLSYPAPILDPALPLDVRTYLNAANEGLTGLLNGRAARQATISLGVKYDFVPNMAVKLQIDHTDISPRGYALWHNSSSELQTTRQKVNTYSLSLNVLF